MARCKECIHYDVCSKEGRMVQVDEHTWDDYNQLDDVERFCDNYIATADVVPKSEVERLQEEANRYKRYYFRHDYDEMIAEVLDKLDRFINANCIAIKDERGIKGYVTSGVHFAIAEHKKKYTEDKNG